MNIPHWIPWKPKQFSYSFRAAPCAVRCNNFGTDRPLTNCNSYIQMKYTISVYEKIFITKRFVTLNKHARNFNFHNKMKTTATLSHTHAAFCLSQLHETHQASIYTKLNS